MGITSYNQTISLSESHPVTLYILGLSKGSRRTMLSALKVIADAVSDGTDTVFTFEWQNLRPDHTAAIRAMLADRYAPSTVNRMLSALRQVLRNCWRLHLMSSDAYRAAADIKNVRGSRVPPGRVVQDGEIAALVNACRFDESPAGVRDAALLAVFYLTGARRASIAALRVEDYDPATFRLVIHGKGNKQITSYLVDPKARMFLSRWLTLRGDAPGAIFCPVRKNGAIAIKQMTPEAIYQIVRRRLTEAELDDFSPHDLRRTFISNLLDRGVDIVTVQKLVGHSSPTTTAKYDRRPEEQKRQALSNLALP